MNYPIYSYNKNDDLRITSVQIKVGIIGGCSDHVINHNNKHWATGGTVHRQLTTAGKEIFFSNWRRIMHSRNSFDTYMRS